jgi:hypothetical protein
MAASRPTRPLLQEIRVIDVSNENVPRYFLLLKMAFQTERGIALVQQALIDGSMRRMADSTTLTECLVLVDKRSPLLGVTLEAGFVSAEESKTARFERLLNVCGRTLDGHPLVHLMTIGAAHFPFRHWMMMR